MVHAQYRSPFKNANIQCTALATHFGFRVGVEKNNLKVEYYIQGRPSGLDSRGVRGGEFRGK